MKRFAWGLLAAVVVGCLPPPLPPTPTPLPTATPTSTPLPTATPTPVVVVPTPIPTATPAATGRFLWVIGEQQLDEAVARALANGETNGLSFRNPRVDLQPGQIVVNGQVIVAVLPIPIQVIVVVRVIDGRAVPTIASVRLAHREAGEPIRQAVEALMAPYLSQLIAAGQNVWVETVTITETDIRVEGRIRNP